MDPLSCSDDGESMLSFQSMFDILLKDSSITFEEVCCNGDLFAYHYLLSLKATVANANEEEIFNLKSSLNFEVLTLENDQAKPNYVYLKLLECVNGIIDLCDIFSEISENAVEMSSQMEAKLLNIILDICQNLKFFIKTYHNNIPLCAEIYHIRRHIQLMFEGFSNVDIGGQFSQHFSSSDGFLCNCVNIDNFPTLYIVTVKILLGLTTKFSPPTLLISTKLLPNNNNSIINIVPSLVSKELKTINGGDPLRINTLNDRLHNDEMYQRLFGELETTDSFNASEGNSSNGEDSPEKNYIGDTDNSMSSESHEFALPQVINSGSDDISGMFDDESCSSQSTNDGNNSSNIQCHEFALPQVINSGSDDISGMFDDESCSSQSTNDGNNSSNIQCHEFALPQVINSGSDDISGMFDDESCSSQSTNDGNNSSNIQCHEFALPQVINSGSDDISGMFDDESCSSQSINYGNNSSNIQCSPDSTTSHISDTDDFFSCFEISNDENSSENVINMEGSPDSETISQIRHRDDLKSSEIRLLSFSKLSLEIPLLSVVTSSNIDSSLQSPDISRKSSESQIGINDQYCATNIIEVREDHNEIGDSENSEPEVVEEYSKIVDSENSEPEVVEEYCKTVDSENSEPEVVEEYSKIVDSEPEVVEEYSKTVDSENSEPKVGEDHSKTVDSENSEPEVVEDHSKIVDSENSEPEVVEEYSKIVDSENSEPKVGEDHSKTVDSENSEPEVVEDHSKIVDPENSEPEVVEEYSKIVDSENSEPKVGEDHSKIIDSENSKPEVCEDHSEIVDSENSEPNVGEDHSKIVDSENSEPEVGENHGVTEATSIDINTTSNLISDTCTTSPQTAQIENVDECHIPTFTITTQDMQLDEHPTPNSSQVECHIPTYTNATRDKQLDEQPTTNTNQVDKVDECHIPTRTITTQDKPLHENPTPNVSQVDECHILTHTITTRDKLQLDENPTSSTSQVEQVDECHIPTYTNTTRDKQLDEQPTTNTNQVDNVDECNIPTCTITTQDKQRTPNTNQVENVDECHIPTCTITTQDKQLDEQRTPNTNQVDKVDESHNRKMDLEKSKSNLENDSISETQLLLNLPEVSLSMFLSQSQEETIEDELAKCHIASDANATYRGSAKIKQTDEHVTTAHVEEIEIDQNVNSTITDQAKQFEEIEAEKSIAENDSLSETQMLLNLPEYSFSMFFSQSQDETETNANAVEPDENKIKKDVSDGRIATMDEEGDGLVSESQTRQEVAEVASSSRHSGEGEETDEGKDNFIEVHSTIREKNQPEVVEDLECNVQSETCEPEQSETKFSQQNNNVDETPIHGESEENDKKNDPECVLDDQSSQDEDNESSFSVSLLSSLNSSPVPHRSTVKVVKDVSCQSAQEKEQSRSVRSIHNGTESMSELEEDSFDSQLVQNMKNLEVIECYEEDTDSLCLSASSDSSNDTTIRNGNIECYEEDADSLCLSDSSESCDEAAISLGKIECYEEGSDGPSLSEFSDNVIPPILNDGEVHEDTCQTADVSCQCEPFFKFSNELTELPTVLKQPRNSVKSQTVNHEEVALIFENGGTDSNSSEVLFSVTLLQNRANEINSHINGNNQVNSVNLINFERLERVNDRTIDNNCDQIVPSVADNQVSPEKLSSDSQVATISESSGGTNCVTISSIKNTEEAEKSPINEELQLIRQFLAENEVSTSKEVDSSDVVESDRVAEGDNSAIGQCSRKSENSVEFQTKSKEIQKSANVDDSPTSQLMPETIGTSVEQTKKQVESLKKSPEVIQVKRGVIARVIGEANSVEQRKRAVRSPIRSKMRKSGASTSTITNVQRREEPETELLSSPKGKNDGRTSKLRLKRKLFSPNDLGMLMTEPEDDFAVKRRLFKDTSESRIVPRNDTDSWLLKVPRLPKTLANQISRECSSPLNIDCNKETRKRTKTIKDNSTKRKVKVKPKKNLLVSESSSDSSDDQSKSVRPRRININASVIHEAKGESDRPHSQNEHRDNRDMVSSSNKTAGVNTNRNPSGETQCVAAAMQQENDFHRSTCSKNVATFNVRPTDKASNVSSPTVVESSLPIVESSLPIVKSSLPVVESCPTVVESCPTVVEGCPTVVESCPTVVEGCPTVVESCPTVVESCPTVAESCPTIAESTPAVVESCPKVVESRPTLVESRPTLVESRPTLVESRPTLVESRPTLVESRPTLVESRPTLVESRPTLVDSSPTLVDSSPTVVEGSPTVVEGSPTVVEGNLKNNASLVLGNGKSGMEKSTPPKRMLKKVPIVKMKRLEKTVIEEASRTPLTSTSHFKHMVKDNMNAVLNRHSQFSIIDGRIPVLKIRRCEPSLKVQSSCKAVEKSKESNSQATQKTKVTTDNPRVTSRFFVDTEKRNVKSIFFSKSNSYNRLGPIKSGNSAVPSNAARSLDFELGVPGCCRAQNIQEAPIEDETSYLSDDTLPIDRTFSECEFSESDDIEAPQYAIADNQRSIEEIFASVADKLKPSDNRAKQPNDHCEINPNDKQKDRNEREVVNPDVARISQGDQESGHSNQSAFNARKTDKRRDQNEHGVVNPDHVTRILQGDQESGHSKQSAFNARKNDKRRDQNEHGVVNPDHVTRILQGDQESGHSNQSAFNARKTDKRRDQNEHGVVNPDVTRISQGDQESGHSNQSAFNARKTDKRRDQNEHGVVNPDHVTRILQGDQESGHSNQSAFNARKTDKRRDQNEHGVVNPDHVTRILQGDQESGHSKQSAFNARKTREKTRHEGVNEAISHKRGASNDEGSDTAKATKKLALDQDQNVPCYSRKELSNNERQLRTIVKQKSSEYDFGSTDSESDDDTSKNRQQGTNKPSRKWLNKDMQNDNGSPKSKQCRKPWTEDEEDRLYIGVQKHGTGSWYEIATEYGIKRSSQQLYDKWRNLNKNNNMLKVKLRVINQRKKGVVVEKSKAT